MPLMHFQTKSMRKTQELQPKLKALQQQYASKDSETQNKLRAETQRLYAENNVNPYAGCLPLLVQMPIFDGIMAIDFAGSSFTRRKIFVVTIRGPRSLLLFYLY